MRIIATLAASKKAVEAGMRTMDFSSWQGAMTTIVGLAVLTLLGVLNLLFDIYGIHM